MIESTARAERYDLQTSTSSFFLWEVPQKPVAVRIPYDLMDRLERQAVESFRSVTRKGMSFDADDVAVLDANFRGPHHIGLLVRPFATKASTGAIFIREGGKIS